MNLMQHMIRLLHTVNRYLRTAIWMALFPMFSLLPATVLAETHSIILGRPTDKSVTASVLFDVPVRLYLEYGTSRGNYPLSTNPTDVTANVPLEVELKSLSSNTRYYYRLRWKIGSSANYETSPEYFFQTQRATGSPFRFIVEADEHLYDKKGVRSIYQICLNNQAKDSADFMLSLGDIFGDDHTPDQTTSAEMDALHKDYRQYLGTVCHSMPFYVCLGNHEGENGFYLKQNPPNNIAVYGTLWRKYYYPNPEPNDFYTGNGAKEIYGMDLPQNYYAFTWGDALFVILDVYRHCDVNEKPQGWDWTLGKTQYDWLKSSLERSNAKYKFVFAHHTRGQGRGGVNTAKGFEWGGYEINKNRWEFDTQRPGWDMPIHQLMVKHGVTIFFQGHDHLYAKEVLDGIVYQETPMPSDSTYQIGMLANADAYTDVTREGTGHLRVSVAQEGVTVDFVRAYLPKDTVGGARRNGEVAHSYVATGNQSSVVINHEAPQFDAAYDSRTNSIRVSFHSETSNERMLELVNMQGQTVASLIIEVGNTQAEFDACNLSAGVYLIRHSQTAAGFGITKVIKY